MSDQTAKALAGRKRSRALTDDGVRRGRNQEVWRERREILSVVFGREIPTAVGRAIGSEMAK